MFFFIDCLVCWIFKNMFMVLKKNRCRGNKNFGGVILIFIHFLCQVCLDPLYNFFFQVLCFIVNCYLYINFYIFMHMFIKNVQKQQIYIYDISHLRLCVFHKLQLYWIFESTNIFFKSRNTGFFSKKIDTFTKIKLICVNT